MFARVQLPVTFKRSCLVLLNMATPLGLALANVGAKSPAKVGRVLWLLLTFSTLFDTTSALLMRRCKRPQYCTVCNTNCI